MGEMKMDYKIVMSDKVKRKLKTMSKKEKDEVKKVMEEIAKNPLKGNPMDIIDITPWSNEICPKHKKRIIISYDRNSKEVHFNCPNKTCLESCWMTRKEFLDGRRKFFQKGMNGLVNSIMNDLEKKLGGDGK
jgi:mRNA-degrading endonuclease RelE of RelBE toxin-antitoxin system